MTVRRHKTTGRTQGARARLLGFAIVASYGAVMGYLAVLRFSDGAVAARGLSLYEGWIVLGGALGGMAALGLAGDRVGQSGPGTMPGILAGLIRVSLLGAIIAGTLALPVYGTMFAPLTLILTLATSPVLALSWVACMGAVHLCMVAYRSDLDPVFTPLRLTQPDCPDALSARVRGHFG